MQNLQLRLKTPAAQAKITWRHGPTTDLDQQVLQGTRPQFLQRVIRVSAGAVKGLGFLLRCTRCFQRVLCGTKLRKFSIFRAFSSPEKNRKLVSPRTFFITIWFCCPNFWNVPQDDFPSGIGFSCTQPPQAYYFHPEIAYYDQKYINGKGQN